MTHQLIYATDGGTSATGSRPALSWWYVGWMLAGGLVVASTGMAQVRFNRDVLPILSAKCFSCHGADRARRKANLRLDKRDSAVANRDGRHAIVPGEPGNSELVRRIFASDRALLMPPAEEAAVLSAAEKQILRMWIAQGAVYERHWAFQPAERGSVPPGNWGYNEVDRFIAARLAKENLSARGPATRAQLIRRVSFDLTGLPPTRDQLDAFLGDDSPQAYEHVVDSLLKSPRFGERMAMWWLDGARYGDSHGYDNDLENSQWPWRNWVIESFNANKRFDVFTIEQIAGDLLPDAGSEQILATAFNRNHRIQTEDGAIDEEWRTEYVIDRIETIGAVWMGLTLGCSRCHDHKYDPISQREFYQLFSLFNNLDEKGFINNLRGSAEPRARYQPDEYARQLVAIENRIEQKEERKQAMADLESRYPLVMVMRDMEMPRQAFVLQRGRYDARGEAVEPGLPAALPALEPGVPVTRLALARWLVSGRHPLTARVVVNRLWEQLFGIGIVASSENLGIQADWPSHPALLDWLAVEFVESGWDLKGLLKQLVMSATYRQSHRVDEERLLRDPQNRLLSRGPRVRLQAEMVRDQALALAGLLVEKLGGPSVRPYQPAGLWEEVEKRGTYQRSSDTGLYRRSLYTAIRRTVPTPELGLFDMPSREVCTIRRSRTNTPLQALALMNDVTYVEAARKFAERIVTQDATPAARIAWAFREVTQRYPQPAELEVLHAGYLRRVAVYRRRPDQAAAILKQGESPLPADLDKIELAAMTTVASVLLNLDEAINK